MQSLSLRSSDRARDGRFVRSRWAATGAAVAVAVAGLLPASASLDSGDRPVFVPITPCRLVDTRPTETVGPRSAPLGANETYVAQVRGANGDCVIPNDAVGVVMNVAAIAPTADSFLTVFPPDAAKPLAANLNWVARQPPVSNAVTADLSADGKVSFYNLTGTVNIAADIVGYFVDHTHDDRYYTKPQVDTALAVKANKPVGTQTLSLDPVLFLPTSPDDAYKFDYQNGDVRGAFASYRFANAAVQLPQGAVITGMAVRASDTDPVGTFSAYLLRNPLGPAFNELMGSVFAAAGTPGSVALSTSTIATPTIDNVGNTYSLRVSINDKLVLYSASITYVLP